MSSEELPVATKRKNNKMMLDSSEEEKAEAEQRLKEEQLKLIKEEKRKRKAEQMLKMQEEARVAAIKEQKYLSLQMMIQEDSDSRATFSRVQAKIRKAYPQFCKKKQQVPKNKLQNSKRKQKRRAEPSPQSQQSQSSSEQRRKARRQKKAMKEQRRPQPKKKAAVDSDQSSQRPVRVSRVKTEAVDQRQSLAKEVARRWWYCLPQWPPKGYPFEEQLKKQGYRYVEPSRFKVEEEIVDGMQKVTLVDGFPGVFHNRNKLIDVRPKNTCPSVSNLKSKTIPELVHLLSVALKAQIHQLKSLPLLARVEEQLLVQLQRALLSLH